MEKAPKVFSLFPDLKSIVRCERMKREREREKYDKEERKRHRARQRKIDKTETDNMKVIDRDM